MHKQDEIMDIHEELGIGLLVISRLYRRELDNALMKYGLTEASALPLRFLAKVGKPLKQKELAEHLNIESATLVKVLLLLENRGFIIRHSPEGDKRVRLVSLSEAGKAFNDRLHQELLYIRMNLFKGLEKQELETVIGFLNTLDYNLRHIDRQG
ncbi:MarR family winged helix-turn-helix transcriptional regulator [Pantoea sp. A4]|uniref:MarR family winged helix-turn-helix transcriptional regulator n=1 Tax=Pantoea sp. A4 TaxID=1225184 RepID=UPI0003679C0D|nr:MarR family transcriptional regulator [Pantoea sp. A4]